MYLADLLCVSFCWVNLCQWSSANMFLQSRDMFPKESEPAWRCCLLSNPDMFTRGENEDEFT